MTKYIDKNHQQDPSKCIVSVIILRDISAYIETCYSLFVVFLQSVNISVLIHITQYTYTIISILMLNIRRLIQQILNFTLKKEIYRLCLDSRNAKDAPKHFQFLHPILVLSNLTKQIGLLDSAFGRILPLMGYFPSI